MPKTQKYTKDGYRKLLAEYAVARYATAKPDENLLADPRMVEAIQERIWQPPAAPKGE